jgi:hypothetical protein
MAASRLRRAAVPIVFAILSIAIGSIAARAQQNSDLDTLNQQVVQLYRAGKYSEATDIAKRVLALTERQFGPEDAKVGTALNNLAERTALRAAWRRPRPCTSARLQLTRRPSDPTTRT